jgi:hypothetical protein
MEPCSYCRAPSGSTVPADLAAALGGGAKARGHQAFTDDPLTPGKDTIIGRAPGYEEARVPQITAGHSAAAVLTFRKIAAPRVEPAKPNVSVADVEKVGGWTRENGVLTRTGGNNIVLAVAPAAGTYTFRAMMPKGKRLQWLVNFVDAKNHVVYELSDDRLERAQYIDGKKLNKAKAPAGETTSGSSNRRSDGSASSIACREANRYPATTVCT